MRALRPAHSCSEHVQPPVDVFCTNVLPCHNRTLFSGVERARSSAGACAACRWRDRGAFWCALFRQKQREARSGARSRERGHIGSFRGQGVRGQQICAIRGFQFHRLAPVLYILRTQLRPPPHTSFGEQRPECGVAKRTSYHKGTRTVRRQRGAGPEAH